MKPKSWKERFKEEFGIHFDKGELKFVLTFIEEELQRGKKEEARIWLDIISKKKDYED